MPSHRPTVLVLQGRSDHGGGPHTVYRLLKAIDRRRIRFLVVGPEEEPYFPLLSALPDLEMTAMALRELGVTTGPQTLRRLLRLIDAASVDIVHSHGRAAGLWSRLIGRARGSVRVVHQFHALHVAHLRPVRRAAYVGLDRYLRRFTDTFVHVSESERQEALRLRVAREDRQIVIPNGIETGRARLGASARARLRRRLGLSPEAFVVVTVTRLCHVKDLRTAAETIGLLRARAHPVHWALVGGADEVSVSDVAGWLDAIGARDAATLAGPSTDVPEWLAAADAYLSTSLAEGLGMSVLEAQAAHLPVVATDVPGHRDTVAPDVGILVPPLDASAAAAAIETLVADADMRARMGAAGAARCAEHYPIARMVAAHEDMYERLIAGPDDHVRA